MAIEQVVGTNSLKRKLTNLEQNAFPTALARAVNRVSNTVKSRSAEDISEATGLKKSSVRRRKYPGVFLARMPNGQVIAVQRSRAGRGARNALVLARERFIGRSGPKMIQRGRWAGKSPHIEAVFGAGIAREAAQPMLAREREATVAERMPIELKHELKFAVQRMLERSVRVRR